MGKNKTGRLGTTEVCKGGRDQDFPGWIKRTKTFIFYVNHYLRASSA
jgi:hypothetical protein